VRADASGALRFPHEFERCGAVLARWPGQCVLGKDVGRRASHEERISIGSGVT